jgi:hypothetical protein
MKSIVAANKLNLRCTTQLDAPRKLLRRLESSDLSLLRYKHDEWTL